MTNRIPFQYAVLQYVHDVVTGEFLNVGLALYSKQLPYFRARLLTQYRRITSTFPDADGDFYRRYITHLQTVFDRLTIDPGADQPSLINERPDQIEVLLAQALPKDDSSIRFSEPHAGLADDLNELFEHLYNRLIERHLQPLEQGSRDDEDVWRVFRQPLIRAQAIGNLRQHIVETKYEKIEFQHAWKNGRWNVLHPISFDLASRLSIQRKAKEWLGTTHLLKTSEELGHLYLLLGKPSRPDAEVNRAYATAKEMIQEQQPGLSMELVEEDQAETFAQRVAPLIVDHSSN